MELKPFFTYFGAKWRAALKYPPPLHRQIIEPFAGGAGYAIRYADRDVLLVEKNPAIAGIWEYLIRAPEAEIQSLPLLVQGQHVDDLKWPCHAARDLVGMHINPGGASPRRINGQWIVEGREFPFSTWSIQSRARVAQQLRFIRHWRVICGDYSAAPDVEASWFIDPPYQGMGRHYPCGSEDLDFPALGAWCRSRRGQVLVCEQTGAAWLPFTPFGAFKSNVVNRSGRTRSAEALWMNDWPGAALWLPAGDPC